MEFINPVTNIFARLWDSTTLPLLYAINLRENVDSLKKAMDELKWVRNDVKRKVDVAERQLLKRKDHVQWWLERVEGTEREVNAMEESFQQTTRCFGNCRPNCWSGYKLGKRVAMKLTDVVELTIKGVSFDVVAEKMLPDAIEEKPSTSALGMDLMLEKTFDWLREGNVIGIYGMGGVGKTTLLKKVNNEFLVRSHEFDVVIWVVVSKELNVGNIQRDIGKRLGLSWPENEGNDMTRAQDIHDFLKWKKFMLLFDDIWGWLDLEMIGIPRPGSRNRSKVIFTTRFEYVCGLMAVDKKVKVECLQEEEAWDLFRQNVGEEAMNSHPEIPILAKSVAKECKGLPLALIAIGRAMACKKTPQEWKHAISVLSTSRPPSEISGMDDTILLRLKFSYDNLSGDTIKSCFLYCALFPEDYSIGKEELIDYWISEGFLDGWDNDLDQARNKGHDLIGRLKAVCLLESGSDEKTQVKLHDVIRDLALWIASECGEKKNKFLVRAGVRLSKAPEVERWTGAERISLMNNNISELMETPQCPNLLTLMLQWNHCEKIHTDFFQSMPLLRVLDLSGTSIVLSELPAGIGNLAELRYLNLSATGITSLPEEIGNLVKMRQLELESTLCLERIPHGLISRLPELRVLNLFGSLYLNWEEGSGGFNMTELEGLERLTHLGITISAVHSLERLLRSSKMWNMIQYLQLTGCKGRTISTQLSSRLIVMRNLKRLFIEDSRTLEEATIGADGESKDDYPASSLEWLRFDCLSVLNCIRVGRLCFRSLNRIHISNCSKLKKIVGLLQLESLETIEIRSCDVLEEVISKAADDEEVGDKGLMQLKAIKLEDLPKLKNICSYAMDFPSLEVVEVINCPKLKKLPLSLHSTQNSLPETRGEKEWWDGLEWEKDNIKASLLPSFKDIKRDRMANRDPSYMLR